MLAESNAAIIDNVTHFLQSVDAFQYENLYCQLYNANTTRHRGGSQIPVCLLVTGPAVTNYRSIYESVAEKLDTSGRSVVLNLIPSDCPNLKTALKHIIQQGTASTFDDRSDDDQIDRSRPYGLVSTAMGGWRNPVVKCFYFPIDGDILQGKRYLSYDLQALHDHVQSQSVSRIVVSFTNGEAFDGHVLESLIDIFQ